MKKILFILLYCFLFTVHHAQEQQSISADSIVHYAKTFLGVKYKARSCDPAKGFDCSGFVYYVFSHFNIHVPRSSPKFYKAGKEINLEDCRPGDVMVFTGTKIKVRKAGHVGIVIENNKEGIYFIHASSGKNIMSVIITSYSASEYYKSRFLKVIRFKQVRP